MRGRAQVPRLSAKQKEALRLYNALALSDKLCLDLLLRPGDIQMLSNHTQLHTRSAFEDYEVAAAAARSLLLPSCQAQPAACALGLGPATRRPDGEVSQGSRG